MGHGSALYVPPRTGGWDREFPTFTPAQLFLLVSDIEKYPLFIPGCIATRILDRGEGHWRVDNLFTFGPVRSRFTTYSEFEAPRWLDVTSRDGPWSSLRLAWRFSPGSSGGCRVSCRFAAQFRSRLLSALASVGLAEAERLFIRGFESRAHSLYGSPRSEAPVLAPR